jgi:CheY-like chemotaxis protein
MKIFILEDDHGRIFLLRKWLQGQNITQVDSCASFGAFVPPYDLILLDHDLGGRQLEQNEDDGAQFAKLIVKKYGTQDRPETIVIVHSFNPAGAYAIGRAMSEAGYNVILAPFGFQEFKQALIMILKHSGTRVAVESSDGNR